MKWQRATRGLPNMKKFNNSEATSLKPRILNLQRSTNMSAPYCLPTDDPHHQVSIGTATPLPLGNVGTVSTRPWCWSMISPERFSCTPWKPSGNSVSQKHWRNISTKFNCLSQDNGTSISTLIAWSYVVTKGLNLSTRRSNLSAMRMASHKSSAVQVI